MLHRSPRPRQTINPGVVNRLLREDLVEIVRLPSPFANSRDQKIEHLTITEAGIGAIAKAEAIHG
jgi:hypothetical protein